MLSFYVCVVYNMVKSDILAKLGGCNYMDKKEKKKVYIEKIKIILYSGVIGVIWVLVWNKIFNKVTANVDQYIRLQTYKELSYIIVTTIAIYVLMNNHIKKTNSSQSEGKLRRKFEKLENNHKDLLTSDERYKLVVEGVRDGIWDWDLVNNVFYSSIKYKEKFGYQEGEIGNTYESWIGLIHEEDVQKEEEGIKEYILSKKGTYENVYRVRCKDGSYRWILSKAKAIWHEEGWPIRIAGSHTDVTEQKEMEDKVYYLAYYNMLTGMPNRTKFDQKINKKIRKYKETGERFAVIYMNADNFRRINDTWGYEVGDELLKYISSVIKKHSDDFYLCAHLGGDEFAIVIDQIDSRSEIINKIQVFLDEFEAPWEFKKHKIFISFSVGIVLYPQHGDSLYSLVVNADTAMWHVKKHGKDGSCFYNTDMQTKRVSYIQTAHQIRKALKNNEFTVYYQPQINLQSGKIAGMEALIRWKHPEKGFISPDDFIPLAEATGEIHAIGRFVLETVCRQKKEWEEKGYPPVTVSVNISGISLTRGDLAEEIEELLEMYQVDGSSIIIEVTETSIIGDIEIAINTLVKIRSLGVKVALDDFGTGYSSLTYLKRLPIDVVKIDREFIKNITNKDQKEIIVEVVVQIAEALNLEVVAEGVETKEQLSYVLESKCEQAQGYFFSRPVAPEEVEKILAEGFRYPI